MKRALGLAILGAALITAGVAVGDTVSDAQKLVDQRVAAMKEMGGKVNEAFQLSGTNAGDARTKLAAALVIAESIPSRFPAGTADGDPGVTTRALPKIWSDQAGFQKAADGVVAALKAADATLAANDSAGSDAAFADVRKACGTCHETYRGKAK
jgi:cytochrome c556